DPAGIGSSTTGTASTSISSPSLSGSTLQIVIRARNSDLSEQYFWDNVKVVGITPQSGTVTVTPSVTGNVTCTATAQLSATLSGGTATAWAWTGPNSFTSSVQNPTVSAGGQYIVTATLSSGCIASAPISISENKTAPDIIATGGVIACIPTVTLNVSSSVSGATYSWTGPGFTSTSKNPVVNTVGTYTATVTNPANGCTASQAVSVSYPAASAIWFEDFTLSNGTTSRSGTTSWTSSTNPSGSGFSVQNNEFRVTNSTTTGEGVWTSGVISINGKTNVSISAVERTSVTGSAVMNTSGDVMDYLRFYYKLNGGPEVLFNEKLGFISSVNTPISFGGLSGSTLQIVVRARATGSDEFYYFDSIKVAASSIDTVNVTANGGVLTCSNTSVTLSGVSTTPGVIYSWSGPNSFTSALQNPSVSVAGVYTLTVTNPSTGCSSADTANVTQNNTLPVVTASAAGQLTCSTPSTTLTGVFTPSTGVTFAWTGPNSYSSATQNPSVSAAGVYTLTVTNTATGCVGSDTANVILNNTGLVTTASASIVLTCKDSIATLTGVSTGTRLRYNWTGPNSFTSTLQNPTTKVAGIYTLTTTDSTTGCTGTDTANVAQNKTLPVVTASAVGQFACNNPLISLSGSATPATGVSYGWTGPNGFTSAVQNPSITAAGIYTLTVTNTTTGCIGSDTANAILNNTAPGASATVSGTLNCKDTIVTLTGTSPTSGAAFSWSGPGGFTAGTPIVTVKRGGNYTLTVTAPGNGCTSTTGVVVSQDTVRPANMTAAITSAGQQLDCNNNNVFLQGGTSTANVNYAWSGPNGFGVTATGTMVFNPGVYTFTAVSQSNFCSASASVTVVQNLAPASVNAVPVISQLTCTSTNSTLVASSNSSNVTYAWSGPGGFSSSNTSITVSTPGNYTVLVTNLANGCTNNTLVQVLQNITPPANVVAATQSGSSLLTCASASQTLTGSSSTAGVSFAWTGPNGFSASTPTAVASAAGTYNLVATNPANGCTVSSSVVLQQNTAAPVGVTTSSIPTQALLTCATTSIALTGSSTTPNVSYKWNGPGGYSTTTSSAAATAVGDYVLTVTNNTNGCTTTATASVTQNIVSPEGVTANGSNQITCSFPKVNLVGFSSTPGVTYSWTGPNGFTATGATVPITAGGAYTLKVTNPTNGCFKTLPTTVAQNTTPPANVTATNSGPLTCAVTEVTLTGSSSSPNVEYQWSGPDGYLSFSAQDVASEAGDYILTVTNNDNGCTLNDTTTVLNTCGARKAVTPNTAAADNTGTDINGTFEFKAYPNPFSNVAFVEFRMPESNFVTVQVYNNLGISEKILFNNKV
ncbi:MAG TPA: hypothetical protein VLD19_17500, partial [Chitinophagaceae bacterium]|nr:hypothetical protein [Chitinophagaceae bacterium]